MAELVLGPLLRHVGEHDATVWVETDGACEVEILGHRAHTFQIAGHHYGLVVIEGLEAGADREYNVTLNASGAGRIRGASGRQAGSARFTLNGS